MAEPVNAANTLRMDAGDMQRMNMRGETLDADLTGELDANAQFAAAYLDNVLGEHPIMRILQATDLSAATFGDAQDDAFADMTLAMRGAPYQPELGYVAPGSPVPQSVSWALMISGIGFAAALFRLSSQPGKAQLAA